MGEGRSIKQRQALQQVQSVLASAGGAESAPDELLEALVLLRELREELLGWEPTLIAAARACGVSWERLAPALGVASRQAAERRYLRLRPSPGNERTGEQRVQAERDKRAADRAVAVWARDNAASLRELAGQVSGATGLTATGRRKVGRVREALGDNDPATLLEPLDAAQPHLEEGTPALAERIGAVADEVEQLRRDSRRRRGR